jgi:ribosome-associated heat shock protein Hsp15
MIQQGLPAERADKWLWAVRFAKTRTEATRLIKAGKLRLGGESLKPSKYVFPGDELEIRLPGGYRKYKILLIPSQRIAAKDKIFFLQDLTPPKIVVPGSWPAAQWGKGRPTKKHRRNLGSQEPMMDPEDWEEILAEWEEPETDEKSPDYEP